MRYPGRPLLANEVPPKAMLDYRPRFQRILRRVRCRASQLPNRSSSTTSKSLKRGARLGVPVAGCRTSRVQTPENRICSSKTKCLAKLSGWTFRRRFNCTKGKRWAVEGCSTRASRPRSGCKDRRERRAGVGRSQHRHPVGRNPARRALPASGSTSASWSHRC